MYGIRCTSSHKRIRHFRSRDQFTIALDEPPTAGSIRSQSKSVPGYPESRQLSPINVRRWRNTDGVFAREGMSYEGLCCPVVEWDILTLRSRCQCGNRLIHIARRVFSNEPILD